MNRCRRPLYSYLVVAPLAYTPVVKTGCSLGAPVGKTHLPEVRVSEHPQALSFELKIPLVLDQQRFDRRTEGRIGHRMEAEGPLVVEWRHDGVTEVMWHSQPNSPPISHFHKG